MPIQKSLNALQSIRRVGRIGKTMSLVRICFAFECLAFTFERGNEPGQFIGMGARVALTMDDEHRRAQVSDVVERRADLISVFR